MMILHKFYPFSTKPTVEDLLRLLLPPVHGHPARRLRDEEVGRDAEEADDARPEVQVAPVPVQVHQQDLHEA